MPSLAETQARFRAALIPDGGARVLPLLAGVPDPAQRLAIYQRHHRQSLVRHLLGRFPTVQWLVGSGPMTELAQTFIEAHPPAAPCMAEYGGAFPDFLAASGLGRRLAYLAPVAQLDWRLGQTAVAIDLPSLAINALAATPPEQLPDLCLALQPGVGYLEAGWPVDELVELRLGEQAPDRYRLERLPVYLEVTGARGSFRIGRLDPPAFAFRTTLAAGGTIAAAVDAATASDHAFDAGTALSALFAANLVCGINLPATGA